MEEEEEFPDQREGENLIEIAGKHWYLLLWPAFKVFLGLVLVFIVLRIAGASVYFTIAFFVWTTIGLTYFIAIYTIWSRSKYYITDQRVIMKEQISLFSKKISEVDISNIHTATFEVRGPTGAAFNYGNVALQSYGAPKAIILKNVSDAKNIQKKISQMVSDIAKEGQKEEKILEEIRKEKSKKTKQPKKYIPRPPRIEE